MPPHTCDYCNDPVYDEKDMGTYISRLCERHYWKMREMEAEALDE